MTIFSYRKMLIKALVFQILFCTTLLHAQKCVQFDVGLYPQFAQWAKGVVRIEHFDVSTATGFVIANPFDYQEQCEEKYESYIYIVTASHVLDANEDDVVTNDEVLNFEAYSLFYFNDETGKTPILATNCQVLYHNKRLFCDELADPPIYLPDVALVKVRINNTKLNQADPWYFALDFAPDPGADYINIHHPLGQTKKLNFTDQCTDGHACDDWFFHFSSGHAQRGSSGSPFINKHTGSVAALVSSGLPIFSCFDRVTAPNFGLIGKVWENLDVIPPYIKPKIGYPQGKVLMGGAYINQTTTIASGSEVEIDRSNPLGVIIRDQSDINLTAPVIDMSGSPSPYGNLRVFNHSNVRISTRELNVPYLQVAPKDPPGSEGWDSSTLDIRACKSTPVENWVFGQDAVAKVLFQYSPLQLGRALAQVSQPALSFSPATQLTLEAPDVQIFQPIETTGFIIPWDEEGFLKIIAGNSIVVNPMDLPQLSLNLATQTIMSSISILAQNSDITLRGTSWRAQANDITMQNMHLYRDVYQDWRPEEGLFWVSEQMNFKNITIDNVAQGDLTFNGNTLLMSSAVFNMQPGSNFSMSAYQAGVETFNLCYGPASQPLINFYIPSAEMQNVIFSISGGDSPQRLPKTPMSLSVPSSTNLSLRAAYVNGDMVLEAQDQRISIETGVWKLTAGSELSCGPGGSVRLSALDQTQLASFNSEFVAHMENEKEKNSAVLAAALGTDGLLAPNARTNGEANIATGETELTEAETLPESYELASYPNPFNAVTNFRLDIPHESIVRVAIYNIRGEEVAILHDGQLDGGSHNLNWNASSAPSGIYFCRMSGKSDADGSSVAQVVKLTLIK